MSTPAFNRVTAAAVILSATVAFSTIVGCASAPMAHFASAAGGTRASLEAFISAEMRAKKIPGLSISVADSTGTLYSKGFGVADRATRRPFSGNTISNVGSVSKLFTCEAIMTLVEAGKVDLDAPLSTYLPEFTPPTRGTKADDITVRRLLTHHSGLSSDALYHFMYGDVKPDGYPRQISDALPAAAALTPPRGPDLVFSYSNLGYALLGLVVERVSGMTFNDYVTKAVFVPLGMADSSFLMDEAKRDRYAMGYLAGKPVFVPYIRDMSAGSLCTSSDDMGRFLSSTLSSWKGVPGVLKQSTLQEMFRVQNLGVPLDFDFKIGLTWWITNIYCLPGEFALGHGGDLPPYHALTAILPDRDLAVHVEVNGVEGNGSFSLIELLSEAVKAFAAEKGQKPFAPPQAIGSAAPEAPLPANLLAELPGFYTTPLGLCQVKRSGNGLKAHAFGQWLDLTYRADGSFSMAATFLGITIPVPVLTELYATPERIDGKWTFNLRIKGILFAPDLPVTPSAPSAAWLARSGPWAATKAEPSPRFDAFKLGMVDGFFCLLARSGCQWSAYPLRIISDSDAVVEGQGRNLGETIRIVKTANGETIETMGLVLRRK